MFGTVFRWEVRALRRDQAFWFVLFLATAAVVFAFVNGARWLAHLESVHGEAFARDASVRIEARAYAARLDSNLERAPFYTRDPRNVLGYANSQMAHYASLPPTPLAALSTGQSDLVPSVLPLVPEKLPSMASNSEPQNPHHLLIGRFDAAFVVIFLVPLLIIALTYTLLSGERERGTLALVLAQPVTSHSLFAAKLLPRMVIGLGLTVLVGLLSSPLIFGSAWGRLALWLAVALAYCVFWFALGAVVAVQRGGSATHAVALAACWLALTVLLPAGINLAVNTLQPMPSRVELILALRAATDNAVSERSKVLGVFYEDHPDLAPGGAAAADEFVALELATDQRVEHDITPVLSRYQQQLEQQQLLVDRLQYLSPALLAQSALAEAAGTGLARYRWFFGQAIAHHQELRSFFEPRALRKEKFYAWDEVPTFEYVEEPIASVAARIAPAIAAFLFGTVLLGLWTWRNLHQLRQLCVAS